jgi:hypothetical protein
MLIFGFCVPLHMHAMEASLPLRWYNLHSWVTTGKIFVSRIIKPLSRVIQFPCIQRPLTFVKEQPKK